MSKIEKNSLVSFSKQSLILIVMLIDSFENDSNKGILDSEAKNAIFRFLVRDVQTFISNIIAEESVVWRLAPSDKNGYAMVKLPMGQGIVLNVSEINGSVVIYCEISREPVYMAIYKTIELQNKNKIKGPVRKIINGPDVPPYIIIIYEGSKIKAAHGLYENKKLEISFKDLYPKLGLGAWMFPDGKLIRIASLLRVSGKMPEIHPTFSVIFKKKQLNKLLNDKDAENLKLHLLKFWAAFSDLEISAVESNAPVPSEPKHQSVEGLVNEAKSIIEGANQRKVERRYRDLIVSLIDRYKESNDSEADIRDEFSQAEGLKGNPLLADQLLDDYARSKGYPDFSKFILGRPTNNASEAKGALLQTSQEFPYIAEIDTVAVKFPELYLLDRSPYVAKGRLIDAFVRGKIKHLYDILQGIERGNIERGPGLREFGQDLPNVYRIPLPGNWNLYVRYFPNENRFLIIGFLNADRTHNGNLRLNRDFESFEQKYSNLGWTAELENNVKHLGDLAMKAGQKGGIDLTPANMNLQTQNVNGEIKFHMDSAMLKQLQNAPGFVPVIINIQPLTNLPEFLGLNQSVQSNVV
jgi:hypothetical protein